jgi:CHAT domain-containing protein/tetratricopeptide (TPR) repeat protein
MLFGAAIMTVPGARASDSRPKNLLVNGGAEMELLGWRDAFLDVEPFAAHGFDVFENGEAGSVEVHLGKFCFWAGPTGGFDAWRNEIYQEVDVALSAGDIDAGLMVSRFAGWALSLEESGLQDFATICLEFRDAGGSVVQSYAARARSEWTLLQDLRTIPPRTRRIRVRLQASRDSRGSTDAFFDELSLQIERSRRGSALDQAFGTRFDERLYAHATTPLTVLELKRLVLEGRNSEAEIGLRKALAAQEESAMPDSSVMARLLVTLCRALRQAGKANDLETPRIAERSVLLNERLFGPEDLRVAEALEHFASILSERRDYAEARPLYERALVIREKIWGPDHAGVATIIDNLAIVCRATADYPSAQRLEERALAILDKPHVPARNLIAGLSNLASLHREMGNHAAALPLHERALHVVVTELGPDHPDAAEQIDKIAILHDDMGDYAAARRLHERALAIWETALGPDHPDVATGLGALANCLLHIGEYAAADSILQRAMAIQAKASGSKGLELAQSLTSLAAVRAHAGDRAEARHLQERALEIRTKVHGSDHPETARSMQALATLLHEMADDIAARPLAERAVHILENALGPDHPDVAGSLLGLARIQLALGEDRAAFASGLRAEEIARKHVRLTMRVLPERQVRRLASERNSGLDLVLSIAARESDVSSPAIRAAWDALVRSRTLVLDEMATRHRAVGSASDSETARLFQNFAKASVRFANLTVRGLADEPPESYRRLLEQAREEKEDSERALAARSASFREDESRGRVGLSEVDAALPPRTALLSFARVAAPVEGPMLSARPSRQPNGAPDHASVSAVEPQAAATYIAFVLQERGAQPVVVPLGKCAEIDTLVAIWRTAALSGALAEDSALGRAEAAYRVAGEALRRRLWDGVAPYLAGADQVFVVPDGPLHLVTLAALPVGRSDYLVESGPRIHYLSAERDLVPRQHRAASGAGLLAMGGAAFDATGSSMVPSNGPMQPANSDLVQLARASVFRGERSDCGSFQSWRFEPLPASERETNDVANLWRQALRSVAPNPGDVVRLTGEAASEAAFKLMAPGKRVLHLATHAFFLGGRCAPAGETWRGVGGFKLEQSHSQARESDQSPLLLSGLALAGANRRAAAAADEEDGILTAEEIAALDLTGVEWAVLSACDTGVGQIEAGEGVVGLRRAFEIAGAGTLIMSLWPVEDEAARRWMRALYESRLLAGITSSESVCQASLTVLRERRRRHASTHPFYWGGFVAAGNWE